MSIYADYNATAPIRPEVADYMHELMAYVGNAASLHRYGRHAQSIVEQAKEQVASLIGASPEQVFFTSGATEANNWLIKGYALASEHVKLAVSMVEHEAVLRPAEFVADRLGAQLAWLPVDAQGLVQPSVLPTADLISVMWANNETGVINDIPMLAQRVKAHGGMIHSDAAQACGKIPINFASAQLDYMSLSSHKIGGPMGVGALIVKDPYHPLIPLLHGGGHQEGLRSGTENIPGIGAFGLACAIAEEHLDESMQQMKVLRDGLERELKSYPEVTIFCQDTHRLPNTSFFALDGISGEMAVMSFDKQGIAVSGGAACGRHHEQAASHVLKAMKVPNELADCAVRVSFGPNNTTDHVAAIVSAVQKIIKEYPVQARRLG